MSTTAWFEAALPSVRQELLAVAAAAPVSLHWPKGGAVLFHLGPLDLLEITGRDRGRFLHAMLSNDVAAAERRGAGHGLRATLNNLQGRVVADLHLYVIDPEKKTGRMLALLERGAAAGLVEMLDRYVIAEKVTFVEVTGQSVLGLAGPDAAAALDAAGASVPEAAAHAHHEAEIGGRAVRIARRELGGGPDDVLLICADGDREAVIAALGVPVGELAWREALRIQGGLPRAGGDVTALNIVLEGGLKERAVSFTKGCYIGQEIICRLDSMGTPARLLVRMHTGTSAQPGDALFADGKEVGYVTSAVRLETGGSALLGYVKKRSNEGGQSVRIGSIDGGEAVIAGAV